MALVTLPSGVREFLDQEKKMLIGGDWATAVADGTLDVLDPATGHVIAAVPAAGAADVDQAVQAARAADSSPGPGEVSPSR